MAAITGAAGLAPTLAAIRRGGVVALANKEALVCAGEVMLRAVRGRRRHPAARRFRAQRHLPVAGRRQPRRRRKDHPDRVGRPVPHRQPGGNGQGHAGSGAAPPGLVDGRQDQHRLRHHDEQGPGADRGRPPVRPGRGPDRRAGAPAVGDPRHGLLPRRHRAGPAWLARTCASRSPTRWPGRSGWPRRRRGSTWPRWRGWISRSPTWSVSRRCGWRARPCGPAAARRHPQRRQRGCGGSFLQRRIGFLDIAGPWSRCSMRWARRRHAGA